MIRYIRLQLYFIIGVLLSAVLVLPAYAGTINYPSPQILERVATPTFSSNAGSVVWASPVNQLISSGRQPVTINMVATRIVQPATVAKLVTGVARGSIQGMIISSAINAAIQASGHTCDLTGCRTLPVPATSGVPAVLQTSTTINPVSYKVGGNIAAATKLAACNNWSTGAVVASETGGIAGAGWCRVGTYTTGGDIGVGCAAGSTANGSGKCTGQVYGCAPGQTMTGSGASATCSAPAVDSSPLTDTQIAGDVSDALKLSLVKEVYEKDVPVDADPKVMTGPASVSSPSITSTTVNNGNTTVTTSSTTVNNSYNGSNVTSTVINNSSTTVNGVPSSTTTETPPDKPEDSAVVTDTNNPEQPKLYERKYPDGFAGVWNTQSAAMKATPLFGLGALFTPSISGGSCPSWTINANIGPHMNYGGGSISPPCWLWGALKAVLIISALLISRRLVFGG
jgi:hypothetical protein